MSKAEASDQIEELQAKPGRGKGKKAGPTKTKKS